MGWFPLITLLVAIVVLTGLQIFIGRTRRGRAFRATADDQATAALMGIDDRAPLRAGHGAVARHRGHRRRLPRRPHRRSRPAAGPTAALRVRGGDHRRPGLAVGHARRRRHARRGADASAPSSRPAGASSPATWSFSPVLLVRPRDCSRGSGGSTDGAATVPGASARHGPAAWASGRRRARARRRSSRLPLWGDPPACDGWSSSSRCWCWRRCGTCWRAMPAWCRSASRPTSASAATRSSCSPTTRPRSRFSRVPLAGLIAAAARAADRGAGLPLPGRLLRHRHLGGRRGVPARSWPIPARSGAAPAGR